VNELGPLADTFVFTLTIDWIAFTLPYASAHTVMQRIEGDWSRRKGGFRCYPLSWVLNHAQGVGLLGTGGPREPREVHVDLSAGIVSSWDLPEVRNLLQWIKAQKGHLTRIDCALDDRQPLVPLGRVTQAAEVGQCISRADRVQVIRSFSLHRGTASGETIYFGSPQSQTLLRVYDKRLELTAKKHPHPEEYGIRWELEFKQDRAQLCGQALIGLEEPNWKGFLIGLLRSYVDFRDTTRDAEDEERARAPRLAWYESLTGGFMNARLSVQQEEPDAPTRRPLSACRPHVTQKVQIAGQRTLYISVHDDDQPAEIFLRVKGSDCSSELIGLYNVIARLMSIALQYGASNLFPSTRTIHA